MAKLEALPDRATIMAMRRRVDFYYWKGIPVARRWPRKSTQPRQAGEITSSEEFTAAAKITGAIAPHVRDYFKDHMPRGIGVTWVDYFRSVARAGDWQGYGD